MRGCSIRSVFFFLKVLVLNYYPILCLSSFSMIATGCAFWPFSAEEVPNFPDINISVSTQNAEGLTTEKLDDYFLKNLSSHLVNQFNQNLDRRFNFSDETKTSHWEIQSTYARFLQLPSGKIAVIQIIAGFKKQKMNAVYIAGLHETKLKRISCVSRVSSSPINISAQKGVCGDKVNEVFGVKTVSIPQLKPPPVEKRETPWWQFW